LPIHPLNFEESTIPMSDPDHAAFRKKLDDFSERLHARTEEFRRTGEFSDIHATLLNDIGRRNDALKSKVAEAEHKGKTWDLVKAELARDYGSLFDDLLQIEERLDAATMKQDKK
jgi:hypothetical protein